MVVLLAAGLVCSKAAAVLAAARGPPRKQPYLICGRRHQQLDLYTAVPRPWSSLPTAGLIRGRHRLQPTSPAADLNRNWPHLQPATSATMLVRRRHCPWLTLSALSMAGLVRD